jgi:hypothetical protein
MSPRAPWADRIELKHPDTVGTQQAEETLWRIVATETVVDDIHLYAFMPFCDQRARKFASDSVIGKNKGLKVYVMACGTYRLEHGGICCPPVLKQGDSVSEYQRAVADRLLEGQMACKDIGLSGLPFEPPDDIPALSC